MKRFWRLFLVFCLPAMLVSCLEDDDEVTYDSTCFISKVTLGRVKRISYTKNSEGKDSIFYSNYSGDAFKMYVNHRTQVIENEDSLLHNSDLSALLMTIVYEGAAVLYRAADDTVSAWKTYKTTDSIDARKPLHLYTLANDGRTSRTYTLKLNVHQVNGDSLYWNCVNERVEELEQMQEMQSVVQNGVLTVIGRDAEKIKVLVRNTLEDQGEWTTEATNLPSTANLSSLQQWGGAMYLNTTDGAVLKSADAKTWNQVAASGEKLLLVGASEQCLYALKNGALYRSADGAQTWEEELLDEDVVWLPSTDTKMLSFRQDNGNTRLVLSGYRANDADTTAVVWNKVWNKYVSEAEAEWIYFNQSQDNDYHCPKLAYRNVLSYDNKCLMFGGASIYEGGTHRAMDAMYFSDDYGITWKPSYTYHLPTKLVGVSGPIASAVDDKQYIWIMANGQVWKGRLNRLGFEKQ